MAGFSSSYYYSLWPSCPSDTHAPTYLTISITIPCTPAAVLRPSVSPIGHVRFFFSARAFHGSPSIFLARSITPPFSLPFFIFFFFIYILGPRDGDDVRVPNRKCVSRTNRSFREIRIHNNDNGNTITPYIS